jgi:hypothetical protein
MSFLDSLENNLKALESREEKDPARQREEAERKERDRLQALAAAPYAQALKSSPWTDSLLLAARTLGHQRRLMVRFTWLDTVLRLEARELRLDLKPTPDGILASCSHSGEDLWSKQQSLQADPEALVKEWLDSLPAIPDTASETTS